MYKFKFADVGEGLEEGIVSELHVKVGDKVKDGDDLFTVETEKVTTEIAAPVDGVVSKILVDEGQTIHVGDVVFHIDTGSGSDDSESSKDEPVKNSAPKKEAEESGGASVVGEVKVSNDKLPNIFGGKKAPQEVTKEIQPSTSAAVRDGVKVLATPFARAVASERNIDINLVKGSGFNGRVLVDDIKSFTGSVSAPQQAKSQPLNYTTLPARQVIGTRVVERVKPTPLRNAIAGVLKNSWNNVAYTNLVTELDVTSLWIARARAKEVVKKKYGINISFLAYISKAISIALKDFPLFNSSYDDKTKEIVVKKYYNIGIAVDTPKGLVVPVVNDVDQLSLLEISAQIVELAGRARDGKLTAKDMADGTFSITNFGSFGALTGVPVIKYPELAIAGIGTIYERPKLSKDGALQNRRYMQLTVATDHRWIDGADIGRFSNRVKELLENPSLLSVY